MRYTQVQLSQIVVFGKTLSEMKFLFQILLLNGKLLQSNSFRRTHHATLSTCKTRLMIRSIRLTTHNTLSTCFFIRSTQFSTRITRLFTRSTRLSTYSFCLSTRSARSTICGSFYHWSGMTPNCSARYELTFRVSFYRLND